MNFGKYSCQSDSYNVELPDVPLRILRSIYCDNQPLAILSGNGSALMLASFAAQSATQLPFKMSLTYVRSVLGGCGEFSTVRWRIVLPNEISGLFLGLNNLERREIAFAVHRIFSRMLGRNIIPGSQVCFLNTLSFRMASVFTGRITAVTARSEDCKRMYRFVSLISAVFYRGSATSVECRILPVPPGFPKPRIRRCHGFPRYPTDADPPISGNW